MKVFLSSVVEGFEPFRRAARRAVENIDATPVMSEDFGARPYSSERACLTEIEGSDVFVLVLGERYGFETAEGISVTQQEFRHAAKLDLSILVFIQDVAMEGKQVAFRQEVEAYHSGYCREGFSQTEQLKDAMVTQLLRLGRSREAVPEGRFNERLAQAFDRGWHGGAQDATFKFAFLPQPLRDVDLRRVETDRDTTFAKLAEAKLVTLRDGYEPVDGTSHAGINSAQVQLRQFEDGLVTFEAPASVTSERHAFSNWYVPPSNVKSMANACFTLIAANGGWCHIELDGMQNAVMQELPRESSGSFSSPYRGEQETHGKQNKLLIPCTEGAYRLWVDRAVARLERQFGVR